MKIVLKSFIQFLSIIACTFFLLLITSFDYRSTISESSAGILTTTQGEAVTFSAVYTVPKGEEKIYDAVMVSPDDKAQSPTVTLNSPAGQLLKAENQVKKSDELVFTFTGDCTLGALNDTPAAKGFYAYTNASSSPTYPFDNFTALFKNDDLTFINFEGTLTDNRKHNSKEYRFAGEKKWAQEMVGASNIEICNVANNHSYDYLKAGYDDTVEAITGAGMHALDEAAPYISSVKGVEVVLLAGNYIHDAAKPQRAGQELTNYLVSQIKKYKKEDNIVIVSVHWGVELQSTPLADQKTRAYAYVDAGADLVIGHHPHVIQGIENYKDKYIVYSLGNFAFGGNPGVKQNVRTTMVVRPRFAVRDGKTVAAGLMVIPCYTTSHQDLSINNYKPQILFGEKAQQAQTKILNLSKSMKYGLTELECPSATLDETGSAIHSEDAE